MDKIRIATTIRELHKQIWTDRFKLWPEGHPSPIEMLHPSVACSVLGVNYEEYPELYDSFSSAGQYKPIGGLLDRQRNLVAVNTSYDSAYSRFTGGHEVAHWLLHPKDMVMHRDVVIKDQASTKQNSKPVKEREADYGSACYLMPENLTAEIFQKMFGRAPIHFDERISFALNPQDPQKLMYTEQGSLKREFALAIHEPWARSGQKLLSLAAQFKVSPSAMAIRIEELDLIRWP